jgi:hypothetical protein
MRNKHKRAYFVDPGYQLPQLAVGLLVNILVVLLLTALLSWFYLLAWDGSIAYNHNRLIPVYIFTFIACVALAASFFSLRRSRELAGMMKKLHRVLDEASCGNFPEGEVVFRKSDHFSSLARPLNDCLAQMRCRQNQEASLLTLAAKDVSPQARAGSAEN